MQKSILILLSIVFFAFGVLGFFYTPLSRIFELDALQNIIHIFSGALVLVAISKGSRAISTFSRLFGIVYTLAALLGFVSGNTVLGLFPVNMADNVLHLAFGIIFFYVGFAQVKKSL